MRIWLCRVFFAALAASLWGADTAPRAKIGIVFDTAGPGDNGFNDSAMEGLRDVARTFHGYFVGDPSVDFGREVELQARTPAGATGCLDALRTLAGAGYGLIFSVGSANTGATVQAAREFPKTAFVLIGGSVPDLKPNSNMTCVSFDGNEGSFLVGMIAALTAKSAPVGFVGGRDAGPIHKLEVGFRAGLAYIDPRYESPGKVFVKYVGADPEAFSNPDEAYRLALEMFKSGAAIIYQAAGGSGLGVIRAAAKMRKYVIGADANPDDTALSPWVLTSMIQRVNRPVLLLTRDFLKNGMIADRYQHFGLSYDAVGFVINARNRARIPTDVTQKVNDARSLIARGKIKVPSTYEELAR